MSVLRIVKWFLIFSSWVKVLWVFWMFCLGIEGGRRVKGGSWGLRCMLLVVVSLVFFVVWRVNGICIFEV